MKFHRAATNRTDYRVRFAPLVSVVVTVVWAWAVAQSATCDYTVDTYEVLPGPLPLWGCLALPIGRLALIAGLAMLWIWGLITAAQGDSANWRSAVVWLAAVALIPLADLLRVCGIPLPHTFFEILLVCVCSGLAAERLFRGLSSSVSNLGKVLVWHGWLPLTVGMSLAAGIWWYWQAAGAYDDFLLGYHDFGHFARRIVNTSEGRGFLLEAPDLPAFWDHFNPGLALLVPLWKLWPDARLFLVLQAICLAFPALLVYAIARRWDFAPGSSAIWAAAYLAFPSVSLLNQNYSYGWHPVSLALPLLFASAACLLGRRPWTALVPLLLACAFKETVFVTAACLAAAMGLAAAVTRKTLADDSQRWGEDLRLATRLPVLGWAATWLALSVGLILVVQLTPFATYQAQRFSNLGDTSIDILLSPFLRPHAFWGQVTSHQSLCFVLALLVPLHLPSLWRGRWTLLAVAPPIGLLLAWSYPVGRNIAFQYVTTLLPVLLLTAMAGAARLRDKADESEDKTPVTRSDRCLAATLGTFAAAFLASLFYGALPWSGDTLMIVRAKTYLDGDKILLDNPRAVGTPGNEALNQLLRRIDQPNASVLATGRVAAHLLGIRRLESVEQAATRWDALSREAGAGRNAIEVFDWVLLDTIEQLQQSSGKTEFILRQAQQAGYVVEAVEERIVLLRRPGP